MSLRRWFYPGPTELRSSPWLRLAVAAAFGLLTGIATAALDVSWQHGLTPAWLDRAILPVARILGVWVEPETDALVVVPAFSGLLLLLVLAWRGLRPGDPGPLRASAVAARCLFPASALVALLVGNWLWLGYIEWWTLTARERMSAWVVLIAPLVWFVMYKRGQVVGRSRALLSLLLTLCGAAVLFGLVWEWDDVRLYVGLPTMYFMRFELPERTLATWLALLCVGPGLVLVALAELSQARGAGTRVGLTLVAGAGLLCWPAARKVMEPYGVFRTEEAIAPVERAGPPRSALLLLPWRRSHPRERPELHEERLRERLATVSASAMADSHRLKRSELARWDSTPGLAAAQLRLAKLRPRRRGWWGTGPAGVPRLPVHRRFRDAASTMAALLPDSPEVQDWLQRCQAAAHGAARLDGRIVAGGPVRVRLFQHLAHEPAEELQQRAQHELEREATFWGWTALLVEDSDASGNFRFTALPAGDYVIAVLLPGSGWRALADAPGVFTLQAGESRTLAPVQLHLTPP
jgi:hypothetical protein